MKTKSGLRAEAHLRAVKRKFDMPGGTVAVLPHVDVRQPRLITGERGEGVEVEVADVVSAGIRVLESRIRVLHIGETKNSAANPQAVLLGGGGETTTTTDEVSR